MYNSLNRRFDGFIMHCTTHRFHIKIHQIHQIPTVFDEFALDNDNILRLNLVRYSDSDLGQNFM